MVPVDITQSLPRDWVYLSEGGSTVVFAYAGPSHPHFTGKVLRLRKTSLHRDETPHVGTIDDDDPAIAFHNIVITALVPPESLPELDIVLLDSDWLAALELLRDGERPTERRAKGRIDKARRKGALATNLIGGTDVLAIEIKPKWGFLPNHVHLSQETAKIKTSTCRFCMHARFKFKDGGLPTQYCPLDFYSNEEARMRKAVCDLWNGWISTEGTFNNMKIFVSGKTIKPCGQSYLSLVDFLSATSNNIEQALSTALLPLLRTPVLGIISNLQRSLDALDIEGVIKLQTIAYQGSGVGAVVRNPSLEGWRDFVASYPSVYCALDHSQPCPENLEIYRMAYSLSATFKDCSVIFRVHQSDVLGNVPVDYTHRVAIIDLDLKGVDRIEKWARLDRQIVEYYKSTPRHKQCVE